MQASLQDRIRQQIEFDGPLSIADYMSLCLGDRDGGYYTTANPIGQEGDFITAPEISQMFGELIGVWCLAMWRNIGSPAKFTLVEMGPGRGTLMADLLRASSIDPEFGKAVEVRLLEISVPLKKVQKTTLANHASNVEWIDNLDDIGDGPALFIGNEFLDALPFRQYVKSGNRWNERMIGTQEGELVFATGPNLLAPEQLPQNTGPQKDGTIFEVAPAREAVITRIAEHIDRHSGACLLIDYGHIKPGFGDTFQAVAGHQFAAPLKTPGKCDLTSHVDFAALEAVAAGFGGMNVKVSTQAAFLLSMGLLERAGNLGQRKSLSEQENLQQAVERLAAAKQMGELFKVLAFARNGLEIVGFQNHAPEGV